MPCNSSVCKGLQGWSVTNCYDGEREGNSYAVKIRMRLAENLLEHHAYFFGSPHIQILKNKSGI